MRNEDLNLLSDQELLDFYYKGAVKDIQEEWFMRDSTKWYEHVISLSDKERITYLIEILDSQVFNGGFDQYFVNGYGQFVKETIQAFNMIKAYELAKITEIAYRSVNNANYDEVTFRRKIFFREIEELFNDNEELDSYLESLDDKYYEYRDNIGLLLVEYLRQ